MDRHDEQDQRIAELEERLSRLGEASLRISEEPGHRHGATGSGRQRASADRLPLRGDHGAARRRADVRPGLFPACPAKSVRGCCRCPRAPQFFEYLSGVTEPLRVSDIDAHMSAVGMPSFRPPLPATALLVAPLRHQRVGVGTIYLAHDEAGRTYSREDEETLAMFASQAAMVIDNARQHRQEQQARADLGNADVHLAGRGHPV